MKIEYKTRDLGLASALLALDFKLVGTSAKDNFGRVYFIFSGEDEQLNASSKAYFDNNLLVSASRMFGEIKRLKSIVHNSDSFKLI